MKNFRQILLKNLLVSAGVILPLVALATILALRVDKTAQSVRKMRAVIRDELQSVSSFALLKSQHNRFVPYFSLLNNVLPVSNQLIDFKGEMERLARNKGVDFGFAFGGDVPPKASEPGRYGFTINSKGDKASLLDFVQAVENSRFLVNIGSLNLSKQEGTFNLTLNGDVFYR